MMKLFFLRSLLRDIDSILTNEVLTGERAVRVRKLREVLINVLTSAEGASDNDVVHVSATVRRKIEKVSWMLSVTDDHAIEDDRAIEFAW